MVNFFTKCRHCASPYIACKLGGNVFECLLFMKWFLWWMIWNNIVTSNAYIGIVTMANIFIKPRYGLWFFYFVFINRSPFIVNIGQSQSGPIRAFVQFFGIYTRITSFNTKVLVLGVIFTTSNMIRGEDMICIKYLSSNTSSDFKALLLYS